MFIRVILYKAASAHRCTFVKKGKHVHCNTTKWRNLNNSQIRPSRVLDTKELFPNPRGRNKYGWITMQIQRRYVTDTLYSYKNRARPTLRLLSRAHNTDALTRKFMNDKPQTLQHHNSVKIARGDEGTFDIFPTRYDTYTSGRLKETPSHVFLAELRAGACDVLREFSCRAGDYSR